MRNGSIVWGLGLVVLGGLLLMQTTGLIPPSISVWSIFWALALILLGANLLYRATGRGGRLAVESRSEPLGDAQQAEISFHHGAGELRVDASAAPDALYTGSFGGGVQARSNRSGSMARVELRVPPETFPTAGFLAGGELNWQVGLNPRLPLALRFENGASHSLLDLRDLQVRALHLQTGASASVVDLPAQAGFTRATVRAGAASVTLRVPPNVAARIRAQGGLASIEVDTQRFPRAADGYYQSPEYETADHRVEIDVETGVGRVEIRG